MSPKHAYKTLRGGIEVIVRSIWQPQTTQSVPSNKEGVINIEGYTISSILHNPLYKSSFDQFGQWLSEPEIEVIGKLEESTQSELKTLEPRKYSGLFAFSHIIRNVEEALRLSQQANVPLDFIILTTLIGHDSIEDNQLIKELLSKWEEAVLNGDHPNRVDYSQKLAEERLRIRDKIQNELVGYIPPNVTGDQRSQLKSNIEKAVNQIFDLTRFSEELPYPLSMGYQYKRHRDESINQTLQRIIAKNPDRISNMKESGLLLSPAEMEDVYRTFNEDSPLGRELRERYGKVRVDGREMPAAERVELSFYSIFTSHFSNQTFNRYALEILEGKHGQRAQELLKLAVLSRSTSIATTLTLNESAIRQYEPDRRIKKIISDVDKDIENKRQGTFYDRITLDGFVKDWLLYSAGGGRFIQSLDKDPEKRVRNYVAARHIQEVIPRFEMFYDVGARDINGKSKLIKDGGIFDPAKHVYFTLSNVDNIMRLMPDYWELVASLRVKSSVKKASGTSTLLF